MELQTKLSALIDLAEQCGIAIRRAPAAEDGQAGALVRLRGREILFIDPQAQTAEQVALLVSVLRGRQDVEDRFLQPELRALLEQP